MSNFTAFLYEMNFIVDFKLSFYNSGLGDYQDFARKDFPTLLSATQGS